MKKLILSVSVMFAMGSFCAFSQDAKPVKKETAQTEQCCKKDAKATDKKACCQKDAKSDKQACSLKDVKKKSTSKTVAGKE